MSSCLSPFSRRASTSQCLRPQIARQQVRHATLIRRPKRPYTFTQLVTLTDGSTYLHRTTSPLPVHKATKDVRNSPLWNPSSRRLLSVEEDEAGKLAGFRSRFGRGWDSEGADAAADAAKTEGEKGGVKEKVKEDSLLDMIGSYSNKAAEGKEGGAHDTMTKKAAKK